MSRAPEPAPEVPRAGRPPGHPAASSVPTVSVVSAGSAGSPGGTGDPAAAATGGPPPTPPLPEAAALVAALTAGRLTLAVAESLTGGAVTAAVVDVPGASRVLRGGVVAYATELKATLLGVDADLLARSGPVHPEVAAQMARGVRAALGADVGLATTGVAGPDGQDGHPPGEVHIAVDSARGTRVESLVLAGDRSAVRRGAVRAVLARAVAVAGGPPG